MVVKTFKFGGKTVRVALPVPDDVKKYRELGYIPRDEFVDVLDSIEITNEALALLPNGASALATVCLARQMAGRSQN